MSNPMRFKPFRLPTGGSAWIPEDLDLRLPDQAAVGPDLMHYLAYIPWDEKYLARIEADYRDFFLRVLPYLHVRTTDVHIATCLPFARSLIAAETEPVDERVVHLAFILHDIGWSQMTEAEIAASLGVGGLALSGEAVAPKARHAQLGRDLAKRILDDADLAPRLSESQREMIDRAVFYHDKPSELATMGGVPVSIRIVCDVDHLWSFTHENFWQDTVRKGVDPREYADNLAGDLDGYFVAEPGRRKARGLLETRRSEVSSWIEWTRQQPA